MEVRPRRAAEAFWRCEQAFERRTRDMTFFSPLIPPLLFISFREGSQFWMDGGALGAGFRGIEVERVYKIMMGTDWEGRPWSPARSRWSTIGSLSFIGRDNEFRAIYPENLGQ